MEVVNDLAGHQSNQRLFSLEVIEEGCRSDIRDRGDLVDGRGVEPVFREKLTCRGVYLRANLKLAALAAADRFWWTCGEGHVISIAGGYRFQPSWRRLYQ